MSEENRDRRQAIGGAIRECRLSADLTQRRFAEVLGVTLAVVRGWESGRRNFYMHEFLGICASLKLDSVELTRRFKAAMDGEENDVRSI